jgi:hypothetical protein
MLDLKELEKMLDDALAKETPESLRKWMISQRAKSVFPFVGENSDFSPIPPIRSSFVSVDNSGRKEVYKSEMSNNVPADCDIIIAA